MWLRYNAAPANGHRRQSDAYIDEVRAWLERLKPKDIHGRLRTTVSMHPWHATLRGKEEEWQAEMRALANYLYQHCPILKDEMDWLLSDAAVSASILGSEIGGLDPDATLLDHFVDAATRQRSVGFARGYVIGLLASTASPPVIKSLNKLIDEMERSNPTLAYHLFTAVPEATDAFERTLRLVDAGTLAPVFLQSFLMTAVDSGLDATRYAMALERLAATGESGDMVALRGATDALAYMVQRAAHSPMLNDDRVQAVVWQLLAVATRHDSADGYNWGQILRAFVPKDPNRASRLAVAALVANHLVNDEDIKGILIDMGASCPDVVMVALGAALLDEGTRIHFYVDNYTDLFSSLPQDTVEKWLQTAGVEGARGLARHLPTPYVDAEGRAVVPPLTAAVLATYGRDERVFAEFQAGTDFFAGFTDELRTQYQRRLELARKLLAHPLERIRQWAAREDLLAHRRLEQLNQEEEERYIQQDLPRDAGLLRQRGAALRLRSGAAARRGALPKRLPARRGGGAGHGATPADQPRPPCHSTGASSAATRRRNDRSCWRSRNPCSPACSTRTPTCPPAVPATRSSASGRPRSSRPATCCHSHPYASPVSPYRRTAIVPCISR